MSDSNLSPQFPESGQAEPLPILQSYRLWPHCCQPKVESLPRNEDPGQNSDSNNYFQGLGSNKSSCSSFSTINDTFGKRRPIVSQVTSPLSLIVLSPSKIPPVPKFLARSTRYTFWSRALPDTCWKVRRFEFKGTPWRVRCWSTSRMKLIWLRRVRTV